MIKPMTDEENSIVSENIKMVYRIVNQFGITQSNPEYDDIVQEASFALMCAAQYYNEDISKFSTYAYACIRGRVMAYLHRKGILDSRFPTVSMETTVPDTNNLVYADVIPDKMAVDDGMISLELLMLCNKVIQKLPTEKSRRIAMAYLDEAAYGYIPRIRSISKRFGVTSQWVSTVIRKYRTILSAELKRSGYNVSLGKYVEN